MQTSDSLQRMYEELANRFAREGEARHRDHCLVLAADAALRAGQLDQAERVRKRLLLTNPHHLLRPFNSMAEAMQSSDVEDYVDDLRRHWPPEAVAKLLRDPHAEDDVPHLEDIEEHLERKLAQSPARKTVKELVKPTPSEKPAVPLTLGEDDLKPQPAVSAPPTTPLAPSLPTPAAAQATGNQTRLSLLLFATFLILTIGMLILIFAAPLWQ